MKKIILLLLGLVFISNSTSPIENKKEEDWESLFDGKTLDGWHRFNRKGVPSIWKVNDGRLTFDPADSPKGDYIHDIVTDKSYENFELSIEWNISEGGNSGIFWAVQEGESYNKPYSTGPEIQVLDNERHPDAMANPKFHQAGALYDLVQPTKDVCKPAGEWNHVLLTIDHNKNQGSVRLNGVKIIEFPLSGPKWNNLVSNSKFNDDCDFKYFGKFTSGKIGLQDHGDKVSFRDIKIRKL
tara:strand:+ start:9261 stop:9980 length:720 start_codon:yes stop_codon:yes gene_type:complete